MADENYKTAYCGGTCTFIFARILILPISYFHIRYLMEFRNDTLKLHTSLFANEKNMYVCKCVCVHVCMFICMFVCMYVCIHIYVCVHAFVQPFMSLHLETMYL